MKKFLTAILAIALIVAMASVSFALTEGGVYIKEEDEDYYDTQIDTLAPGETAYVYIGEYDRDDEDTTEKPTSISIEEHDVTEVDSGDEVKKMITVDKKGEKKKVANGEYGWFAKIKAKAISLSNYPEDGYDVMELVIEFDWDGDKDGISPLTVDLDHIGYEEAEDEFEDDPKLFEFEKDDDVEIDLPDEAGVFEGVARKDFEIVAGMDTDVNNSLLNKYPNADIQFFNGNGANFPVTKGRLTIYADDDYYCYEVDSSGKLIDRTSTYSSSEKGFYISTTKIGKYIISDTKLASKSSSSSVSSTGSTTSSTTTTTTTAPVQTTTPTYRTYTVVKGDSLWSIAQRYLGNGWRYPEIVRLNNMTSNFIFSGQTLWLPN